MKNEKAIQIIKNMIQDDIAIYGNKPKLRNEALDLAIKALEARPQGEWVGINEYLKHLEEETGERYKVSKLYDGSIFCNQCWKMNNEKSCYCPNCGADMRKGGAE